MEQDFGSHRSVRALSQRLTNGIAAAVEKELDATCALHDSDIAMHKAEPLSLNFTHSAA